MKPIFRLLMLFILAVPSSITAQEISNACNLSYKISVNPDSKLNQSDIVALMDWDFTEAISSAKSIVVELVPINDCYNKENAILFKKPIVYTINNKNSKLSSTISHVNLNTKCFKYRVIVETIDCNKTTDWTYYNFVQ